MIHITTVVIRIIVVISGSRIITIGVIRIRIIVRVWVIGVIVVVFVVVIVGVITLVIPITEEQTFLVCGLLSCHSMYSVNHFLWHWQLGSMVAIDDTPCVETQKIESALNVPSRSQRECSDGSRRHTAVVLLMRLYVLTKIVFAVALI